jgi:hypothetical protein
LINIDWYFDETFRCRAEKQVKEGELRDIDKKHPNLNLLHFKADFGQGICVCLFVTTPFNPISNSQG